VARYVLAIHVFCRLKKERRGCPRQARAWRCKWQRTSQHIPVFAMEMTRSPPVMAGLVPAIHVFLATGLETWMRARIC